MIHWRYLIAAIIAVYALAVGVDIMDVDASQYAAISREMLESGNYLQVFEQGRDYLDKPPLLFWVSSLSMSVFGTTNLAYKLPAILAALFAIYTTYRFTQLFYEEKTARLAALILATTQAMLLITNDVRTDTLLMALTMFSIWKLSQGFLTNQKMAFFWGFIGLGLGMLAKGPVAVVIPVLAFSTHFLLKKQFKQFIRSEYLWGIIVVLIVLLPMCIGLYQQFDLHPEKIMYGKSGTSGLRFFFWTQSFGRITGENIWKNDVYFTFLFENMLWAFAPWTLFFIASLICRLFVHLYIKLHSNILILCSKEWITLGGFVLGYFCLATSKYQLPHYLFVVYPFAAIITADFIQQLNYFKNAQQFLNILQWILISLIWVLPLLILTVVFPAQPILLGIYMLALLTYLFLAQKTKDVLLMTILTTLCVNICLSTYFYPNLLQYQVGSRVGKWVQQQQIPNNKFSTFCYHASSSLHFYAQRIVPTKQQVSELKTNDIILTDIYGIDELQCHHIQADTLWNGYSTSVATLKPAFLNHKTRNKSVKQYFILKIQ